LNLFIDLRVAASIKLVKTAPFKSNYYIDHCDLKTTTSRINGAKCLGRIVGKTDNSFLPIVVQLQFYHFKKNFISPDQ
jgi:hypothetical protein